MPFLYEDFKDDPIVYIEGRGGIAINLSENRVLVFKAGTHDGKLRVVGTLSIEDIRTIDRQDYSGSSSTHIGINRGGLTAGAEAIGGAIGHAGKAALDHRKTRRNTGIKVYFKSTQTPSVFLQVEDGTPRDRLIEAIRQAVEEGNLDQKVQHVNDAVFKSFPTLEMKENREKGIHLIRGFIFSGAAIGLIVFGALESFKWIYNKRLSNHYVNTAINNPNALANATGKECTNLIKSKEATNGNITGVALSDLKMYPMIGSLEKPRVDKDHFVVFPKGMLLDARDGWDYDEGIAATVLNPATEKVARPSSEKEARKYSLDSGLWFHEVDMANAGDLFIFPSIRCVE